MILYFCEYLLVGIFGMFWIIQIPFSAGEKKISFNFFWHLYFMAMVHLVLAAICTANYLVKKQVNKALKICELK